MSAQSSMTGRPFLKLHYDFLEEVMPVLTGNEFKVAITIYREIMGWSGRTQAALSYSELEQKTGMARATLAKALKGLIKKGIIQVCDAVGRWGMKIYSLAKRFLTGEEEGTSSETILVQRQLLKASSEAELVLVQKLNHYQDRNDTGSSSEAELEATPEASPQQAPDEPKETLKERERNIIEREVEIVEEEKIEEDENDLQAPEWGTVLEQVAEKVSPGAFNSWFQGSKGYKRNDQFVIQVEDSFHKQYLKRQADMIFSLLIPLLPASTEIFIATAQERHAAWAS